jgi:putative chitinase
MTLTLDQFQAATGSTAENAQTYYDAALETFERFSVVEPTQIAAFCATLGVESQRLTKMEENLYYTHPDRLAKIFRRVFDENHDGVIEQWEIERCQAYCRNPQALSIKLYGGFHGRGGFQLTWERNYKVHGKRLGFDYLSNPDLLLEPQHAILSAGSFWDLNQINDVADRMDEVTFRVNGPARLGLAERIALYNEGLEAIV